MPEPTSLVVVDPAFLGDVVFDGPLVRAARLRWPSLERVGIVVRPPADAVAARLLGVDRVHVFDKRNRHAGVRGLLTVAAELRAAAYDVAVVPHASPRSAILVAAAQIPERIGSPSLMTRPFFTRSIASHRDDGFVRARLRLVDGSDARLSGSIARPELGTDTRWSIGLCLGSEWATKRWPAESAAELVAGLDGRFRVVLLGSESERSLFAPVLSRPTRAELLDAVGGSVLELIDWIETLDALVGGDTGPVHVARAMGVPVVAIFGPTSERRHEFAERDRVLWKDLECRPCGAHGHHECPLRHHRCMKEIDPAQVRSALDQILSSVEPKP